MQGRPYLAAAIPGELDDEGREWLKSGPAGLSIAMHGLRHFPARLGVESEFAGLSHGQCLDMIWEAKELLGLETSHFVAPWNHYTQNLVDALLEEDIDIHWTGAQYGTVPPDPIRTVARCIVPAWATLYGSLLWPSGANMKALSHAMPEVMERPGCAVLTLHITWESRDGMDFSGIRWLIEHYGDRIISPEQYLEP